MATRKLKLQVLDNLKELAWALIMFGICVYAEIQVLRNGPGKRFAPEPGLKGMTRRFLYWLEDTGHGELVAGMMLVLFGVAALVCLFLVIYHLGYLTPKRSILGRSILAQAAPHEAFDDLVHAIDTDIAMESREFGTELVAGSQWMLSEKEAMRIGKIERLYIGKKKVERKYRAVLLAADGKGNTSEIPFYQEENRDEAVQYLRRKIPGLYVGDLTEKK